jgi:hypothetical protein
MARVPWLAFWWPAYACATAKPKRRSATVPTHYTALGLAAADSLAIGLDVGILKIKLNIVT